MSVIIKDMKIPQDCFSCPLREEGFCNLTNELADDIYKRSDNCPLVELPEHHGRLIDADRLMKVYEDRLNKVIDKYGVYSSERGILSGAMKLLLNEMIEFRIVEAEGDD